MSKTNPQVIPKATKPILPITVQLVGNDGNAFSILGAMSKAFRKNGYQDRWEEFQNESTQGSYDDLLATCMKWVNVE